MARSVSIASFLLNIGQTGGRMLEQPFPARPPGILLWARCSTADQLDVVEALGRQLAADGDPVEIVASLRDWDAAFARRAIPEPQGRDGIRAFLGHWQPAMVIWVKGDLDMLLMAEIAAAGVACLLIDAAADITDQVAGRWVPGALRAALGQFEAITAVDQLAADSLIRNGAQPDKILMLGALADTSPGLPCPEETRADIATAIGSRPVWLCAAAQLTEWAELCEAQQEASHRAHRLLLIVVPKDPADAPAFATHMREAGFRVALQSGQALPDDLTEIYIVDAADELGLWYRIAPITYLGGTLTGGGCRDPFEPAAAGSAVVYGPHVKPFQRQAARLNAAGGSRLLRASNDLGPAIETLLAADKTAALAHAAWDVTSRGAAVTSRIAAHIQTRLDSMDGPEGPA